MGTRRDKKEGCISPDDFDVDEGFKGPELTEYTMVKK
jgi:hypothetical protein